MFRAVPPTFLSAIGDDMKLSPLWIILLLYLIPWSWVTTKEEPKKPWFHWGFGWWLTKTKIIVFIIVLPLFLIPWGEALGCGDNITPDETPNVHWPENLS